MSMTAVPSCRAASWITTAPGRGLGRASATPPHEFPEPSRRSTVTHPDPGPLTTPVDCPPRDFTVYSTRSGPTSVTASVAGPNGPLNRIFTASDTAIRQSPSAHSLTSCPATGGAATADGLGGGSAERAADTLVSGGYASSTCSDPPQPITACVTSTPSTTPAPTRRALIAAPPVVLRGVVPLIPAAAPATDRNSRHEQIP